MWLHGEVKTPPLSAAARLEAGYLLRVLQSGGVFTMPNSRQMPAIGRKCHELRITEETKIWRIVYRIDADAIVIAEVFEKKTTRTPKYVIGNCKARLRKYDDESN